MKQFLLFLLTLVTVPTWALRGSASVHYDDHFEDRTLRVDYIFSGDNRNQQIYLNELLQSPHWYGRRVNMDKLLLEANGQVAVTDTTGRDTLYVNSFSTLFLEWQTEEEATKVQKAFEHVVLLPFPKHKVKVTVSLWDTHNEETSRLEHIVDPTDILIRPIGERHQTPWRYVQQSGSSNDCIDIAIVAEGYTEDEMDTFYADCQHVVKALESHEPFKSEMDKLNFIAVECPSKESGVSVPHEDKWVDTAIGTHYDTFYSERYNTVSQVFNLHDLLAGIPYEHIIVLVNTPNYGGGGIFNAYITASTHHRTMEQVVVHEFGHSFAGLGDEYFYDDMFETRYPSDTEPWEPNITTLVDFDSKWKDMLDDQNIPSIPDGQDIYTKVGVYEGGGYQSKGVYRPTQDCRMKTNEAPVFCPVCERAIRRIIHYQVSAE